MTIIAVLAFEVVLNATAMVNHANASVPERFERWLRWLVVTPDMHRVHHWVRYEETVYRTRRPTEVSWYQSLGQQRLSVNGRYLEN